MPIEFRHEALAELHHFIVRTTVRIEVRTTLGSADRESSQCILVYLLKGKEFQNIERNARMEAKTALIRSNCA